MSWVAYTDGGCKPNPGRGGYGVVLLRDGELVRELSGGELESSNNRMELCAAIEALRAVPDGDSLTIHVDSSYVKNGITKWLRGWRAKGWRTSEGEPVKNRELWEALAAEAERVDAVWKWVKGHSGDRWNERADELASAARRGHAAGAPRAAVAVEIACAAAWSSTTQRGGWAALLRAGPHRKLLAGSAADTSANRMHIESARRALETLTRGVTVRVVCANDYVIDGATKWLPAWRRRDWLTAEGQAVKNRDLWEALDAAIDRLRAAGGSVEWCSAAREGRSGELLEAKQRAELEARGSAEPG